MLYPGTLGWHQGLDIAVKAFASIKDQVANVELHIYGSGLYEEYIIKLIDDLALQDLVIVRNSLPLEQIADVMANADLGIVPKRNDPFGGEAFSTKILEFMSLGVPLIVSETKIDKFYFNDSVVKFFKPDDVNDLAQCMLTMINDETLRKQLAENASKFVEDFDWDTKKAVYLNLIDSLGL
jgi:glycosyltransferase involved in cell wall biosynthesis